MGIIFKSKEVYKHLEKKPNEQHKMVPVQGLYVSGEWRPPYYNDPALVITQFTSENCIPASFKSVYQDFKDADGCIMYGMNVSAPTVSIQRYTKEFVDLLPDPDGCAIYDMDISQPSYSFMRYSREYDSAKDNDGCGMYDINLNSAGGYNTTRYGKAKQNSTPEPILRVTQFISDPAVVENFNP